MDTLVLVPRIPLADLCQLALDASDELWDPALADGLRGAVAEVRAHSLVSPFEAASV